MNALEIFVLVYGLGWLGMSVHFGNVLVRATGEPDGFRSKPDYQAAVARAPRAAPVLAALVLCVIAIAAGSVWWVFLLSRLAIFVWHHAGHPGAD